MDELFRVGQPLVVRHGKPRRAGRPIEMVGVVGAHDGDRLVMRRRFRRPGLLYDGLDARQRAGDHGAIELIRGGWVSRRRYLRRAGQLIGDLYNIQTPTRFAAGEAGYVDLEIDVAYLPGRAFEVQIQDEAELDRAEAAGHIPPDVAAAARAIAAELAGRLTEALASGADGLDWDIWDVRPPDEAQLAASLARLDDHQKRR